MTANPSGRFIQKTHSQSRNRLISPPQRGPMTPPASADAPMIPNGTPRRSGGNRSATMAMEMGTSAPAPTA